jgi:hypothetical protein
VQEEELVAEQFFLALGVPLYSAPGCTRTGTPLHTQDLIPQMLCTETMLQTPHHASDPKISEQSECASGMGSTGGSGRAPSMPSLVLALVSA